MIESPYKGLPVEKWEEKTKELISDHPLDQNEIVEIILKAWSDIYLSRIGSKPFYIGKELFLKPQIMGFFLHQLIPLELSERYPNIWRIEKNPDDKDIVYIPKSFYSVEIKTSSNKKRIFGNRSYAQAAKKDKKSKSGYYLAINFQKFEKKIQKPEILKIRFGWIDHEDWLGQKASTGQQARLDSNVENLKLFTLYLMK